MILGLKRKIVVTGHFGSGKTEFSVSLAMQLANQRGSAPVALVDLDIVKPYFRSRERRKLLEDAGISVYGSAYKEEITAEVPALGPTIKVPLEDKNARVIVDLGGNDGGALVLNQFSQYFIDSETLVAAVVNINRPDTDTAAKVLRHIEAIEAVIKLDVTHIISNTHMLRETTARDIENGYRLCRGLCRETQKKLLCVCYPDGVVNPEALRALPIDLIPLGLYMRPSWLNT